MNNFFSFKKNLSSHHTLNINGTVQNFTDMVDSI